MEFSHWGLDKGISQGHKADIGKNTFAATLISTTVWFLQQVVEVEKRVVGIILVIIILLAK